MKVLFCLPYAGGRAAMFNVWKGRIAAIDVRPVELPGHGVRHREPPLGTMEEIVEAVLPQLDAAPGADIGLFGHSMGALVAFELARALRRQGRGEPRCLFVSGCSAPHLPRRTPDLHKRPDAELLAELVRLAGTPAELLRDPEFTAWLLPTLRADFRAIETYRSGPEPRLSCPIVAFAGAGDPTATPAEVGEWRAHTSGGFTIAVVPGGHFFLHDHAASVLGWFESQVAAFAACSA